MSCQGASPRVPSTVLAITTAPVIITLLFSIAAWTITHTVDRLLRQPIIKIQERVKVQNGDQDITLTITNITQNIVFKGVVIEVLGDSPSNKFSEPNDRILGGGWDGEIEHSDPFDTFTINLPQFHPRWGLEVKTTMTGGGNHRVQLKKADVATILQQPGLTTFLIANEILITVAMAGVTICCIVVWACRQRR